MDEKIIISMNINGKECDVEVEGMFQYDGEEYLAAYPVGDEETVILCKVEDLEDGSMNILPIEDEKRFDNVFLRYTELMMEKDQEEALALAEAESTFEEQEGLL